MPRRKLSRRELLKKSAVALAGVPAFSSCLAGTVFGADQGQQKTSSAFPENTIVSVHPEADAAAMKVFQQGGNAVDAAVAAAMALCVVLPGSVGFGGYGGSLVVYQAKKKRVTTLDFDSRAPLEFKPELIKDPEQMNHGPLAVGVPAVVAGFNTALRKFGTLPWRVVAEHALDLAENGFEVSAVISQGLKTFAKLADPASAKAFFPTGKAPEPGERWVQKDLAQFLRVLDKEGPDTFYHGEIARKIVGQIRATGGVLSEKDLKEYKPLEAAPLHIAYRGYEIYTPPPPSGGITSLSILKTLEQFDIAAMQPWSAEYFHTFAEAAKLCWAERFGEFGDPDNASFSAERFLSGAAAAARAKRIHENKVGAITPPPAGGTHTGNILAIDRQGNAVAMTATHGNGFGSRVVIEGLGLLLGQGMSRFTLKPGSPNYPAPGKRMQHNMSPMVLLRDGRPAYLVGMPGGRAIVTVTTQLVVDIIDFKSSADDAVYAPRLHTEGEEPLTVSPKTPEAVVSGLAALGHQVKRAPIAGPANVAIIDWQKRKIDFSGGRKLPGP